MNGKTRVHIEKCEACGRLIEILWKKNWSRWIAFQKYTQFRNIRYCFEFYLGVCSQQNLTVSLIFSLSALLSLYISLSSWGCIFRRQGLRQTIYRLTISTLFMRIQSSNTNEILITKFVFSLYKHHIFFYKSLLIRSLCFVAESSLAYGKCFLSKAELVLKH